MLIAFIIYFIILFFIAIASQIWTKKKDSSSLILGNRSLNFWVTALSAQASDMSNWLFMAFPAAIFAQGMPAAWAAIGLVTYMFLNWHFIAPKIRQETEKYQSNTLSSYFEKRFFDNSGRIGMVSALVSLIFFTVYIAVGLKGIGLLFESVFNLDYTLGLIIAVFVVITYTTIGGFVAVAWTDFFQAIFLLVMIILVPSLVFFKIGSFEAIKLAAIAKNTPLVLLPDYSTSVVNGILLALGWGLGYFGMPHILNKFMGIRDSSEMYKAKYVGITWQILSLSAAIFVGLVGMAFFSKGLVDDQLIFIEMVKSLFSPFFGGFVLCAIFAAIISTVDSQIIVLASSITEDFYKKLRPTAKERELKWVYRIGILLVCIISLPIALHTKESLLDIVWYAWTGLGSSFGPLVILSLYSKNVNKHGALAGIITGCLVAMLWKPCLNGLIMGYSLPDMIPEFLNRLSMGYAVPGMIPGFFLSLFAIWGVSKLVQD